MLVISKGKGSTQGHNTKKLTPTQRLESLHDKNYSYNPEVGKEGMKQYDIENSNIYKDAKKTEEENR